MLSRLLDLLYAVALLVAAPWLLYRRYRRGPQGTTLRELLGYIPPRSVAAHCVWIHGVSLGEINATRTLVAALRRRSPDTVVVLSSTTRTGREQAHRLYPHLLTFRYPLDFSWIVRRVLRQVRPSAIVLMELEIWPNLILLAHRYGIPVLVANGRITEEKSMRRFRLPGIRWLAREVFQRLAWVGAQDETYAARFVELGVPEDRVEVTGSVKYDAADLSDRVDGQEELADSMGIRQDRPLWVCGSTGPGEESQILDGYSRLLADFPELQLAIIPRKPERFDEVARLIVDRGFTCLRRSTGQPTVPPNAAESRPVFLGDTMGELRKFYALATVVFVGRTLVPLGGSDVMEVAGLAKPVLVGPHVENFREAVELLVSSRACRQLSSMELIVGAVGDLLRHPARRAEMGAAGRAAILSRRGATECTVREILARISG